MIMYWTGVAMPCRKRPYWIEVITMTPSSAFQVRPRPPKRLVPPMTAAAMAFISRSPPPAPWLAAAILEARKTPPTAAKVPAMAKTEMRTAVTLIPARRDASTLPPSAKILRP